MVETPSDAIGAGELFNSVPNHETGDASRLRANLVPSPVVEYADLLVLLEQI